MKYLIDKGDFSLELVCNVGETSLLWKWKPNHTIPASLGEKNRHLVLKEQRIIEQISFCVEMQ
jgi:hypothetical protein